MLRAVLFDADGVLVDSYQAYRRIWHRWSNAHGLDSEQVWAATHGRRPRDTVVAVAPSLDAATEYRVLQEFMADEEHGFQLFPGVAEALTALARPSWGVVTSGSAETVRGRLARGGAPAPSILVDGAMVARGKPDPEGYLMASRLLGVPAAGCLVIEDAPEGIRAAMAAGMPVVAISSTHDAAQLAEAQDVVATFAEAESVVESWLAMTAGGGPPRR